jgi:hypothetical protein
MKQKYRIADAVIQAGLLVAWLVFAMTKSDQAFYMYFIVGGWYLFSLIIHSTISLPKHQSSYNTLLIVSLLFIVFSLVGFFLVGFFLADVFLIFILMLLFIGPVMALLYTYTCVVEIKDARKRPISLLK